MLESYVVGGQSENLDILDFWIFFGEGDLCDFDHLLPLLFLSSL